MLDSTKKLDLVSALSVSAFDSCDALKHLESNIVSGFKTPKEAIEGNYIDKKCPFTSDVSIRGRILK